MPLYSVASHPLLTPKVRALDPPVQEAQQELAETLLGLETPVFIAADPNRSRVETAIVLQMNFQVAQGVDPLILYASSSSHTKQSQSYRPGWLDPRAAQIVTYAMQMSGRRSHRFADIVSHRTNDGL